MNLFAWMPRPFASWIEFLEYLVFITVCVAGVLNGSWLWPLVGAMTLLLLSWSRYRHLFTRAARIDADYRDLAWLERAFKVGNGLAHYAKARTLPIVLAAKIGHDALFLAGAFIFGHLVRWVWIG